MKVSFRRFILRLSIAGIIILVAFPLGVLAYLHTINTPDPVAVKSFQDAVKKAASHDIAVLVGDRKFTIKQGEINGWAETYTRAYSGREDARFTHALDDYVQALAIKTDRPAVDARFTINASGSPTIIIPARNGQQLNPEAAKVEIREQILNNATTITLNTETIEPAITEEKIRSLGVNTRIAIGESNFAGSTAARIKNIKVSSKLFNGLIIKPGETFSFNTILGEVDAAGGYAPEKVIKNNRLQYEYGGGICQVSTTLFRAAMAAGFPILERKGHAFAVSYYGPPGYDATIYPGQSDMRFKNDTANPVLIQTHITGTLINFEIYGTKDGRSVVIDGPHQYDIQPDGSMKAYVARAITYADGTTKTDRFNSTYKSPKLFTTDPNPYQ